MLLKELLYSHLIFSCKLTMNNYYGYTCNITPKMFLGTSTIYLKGVIGIWIFLTRGYMYMYLLIFTLILHLNLLCAVFSDIYVKV